MMPMFGVKSEIIEPKVAPVIGVVPGLALVPGSGK